MRKTTLCKHALILFVFLLQGVKQLPTPDQMKSAKSALDNIVGNLWQTRQESSGSSVGNQVWFYNSTGR